MNLHLSLHDVVYFVVVTIGVRFIVVGLLSTMFFDWLEARLVKTEHDAIYWTHYEKHAMKQGHSARHPVDCWDNGCQKILQ